MKSRLGCNNVSITKTFTTSRTLLRLRGASTTLYWRNVFQHWINTQAHGVMRSGSESTTRSDKRGVALAPDRFSWLNCGVSRVTSDMHKRDNTMNSRVMHHITLQ